MNRSVWIPLSLAVTLILATLVLSACDSLDRPAAPGATSNFTQSNCNGVLGNNTAGSGLGVNSSPIYLNPYLNNESTTLEKLSFYAVSANPITYELGVYTNISGAPGNLIAETGPQTIGPVTAWSSAPVSHNTNLSAGTTYWVGVHSTGFGFQSSGSTTYATQTATFGALPASCAATPTTGYSFSVYGTTCP